MARGGSVRCIDPERVGLEVVPSTSGPFRRLSVAVEGELSGRIDAMNTSKIPALTRAAMPKKSTSPRAKKPPARAWG